MTEFPATTDEAHSDGRLAAFCGQKRESNPYRTWSKTNRVRKAWDNGFDEGKQVRESAAAWGRL